MKIFHEIREVQDGGRPVCAAVGFFDGVHRGHQQVIGDALRAANRLKGRSLIITFDPHPLSVLAPQKKPALIYPLEKKLQLLASIGVDMALVLKFDATFSRIPGWVFLQQLVDGCGKLHFISVGKNFNFGHERSGNIDLLNKVGHDNGFQVSESQPVLHEGTIISSTRIRLAIQSGDFHAAELLLGRPYTLTGLITQGDRIGRQLGFPTANLDTTGMIFPPHGVYAVRAFVQGEWHNGVLNIGIRPTLKHKEPQLRIEAHLFQFNREIYRERMEIAFCGKIREEKSFASLDLLKQQIHRDVHAAQELLNRLS